MQAYELLAKLRILTLSGQDEDGDLEWIGTRDKWESLDKEERNILGEVDEIPMFAGTFSRLDNLSI